MHRLLIALLCATPSLALATTQTETQPGPTGGPPPANVSANVEVFEPAFFASARPSTAYDMLLRIPGFSFHAGDQNIRGLTGSGGNVLIDGVRPASKSESLRDVISRIPAGRVARVEMIRGGVPGIDMEGHTVVANIVRRTGSTLQKTVTLGTNLVADGRVLPEARLELSGRGNALEWDAQLSRFSGLDDAAGDGTRTRRLFGRGSAEPEVLRIDTEADSFGYEGRAGVRSPLLGGTLSANLSVRTSRSLREQDVFAPAGLQRTESPFRRHSGEAGFNWEYPVSDSARLTLTGLQRLAWDKSESRFSGVGTSSEFVGDARSGESIARATLHLESSETLSFEAGGEAAYNFLQSESRFVENGQAVDLPSDSVRVGERRGQIFGKAIWQIASNLSLEAGSRLEASTIAQAGDVESSDSFLYPKPRAVLTWSPGPATRLRLRVEREVGQLDFYDFVASAQLQDQQLTAGNPDLRPEKSWVYEAAFERRFWDRGAIVLTLRHRQIGDAVDLIPILGPGFAFDAPGNIGTGRSSEAQLRINLPLDRLGLRNAAINGEVAFRESRVTDPTTGEARRISGQRPFGLSAGFTHDLPAWNASWGMEGNLGFRQIYYRLSEVRTVEATPFVGFFGEYKPSESTSIRLRFSPFPFHYRQRREIFSGPRSQGALFLIEDRDLVSSRRVSVQLRRSF